LFLSCFLSWRSFFVFKTKEMNEGIKSGRNARANWGVRVAAVAIVAVLACATVFVYSTSKLTWPRRTRATVLASLWVVAAAAALAGYKLVQAKRLTDEEPEHATPEHVFVPEAVAQAAAQEVAEVAEAAAQPETQAEAAEAVSDTAAVPDMDNAADAAAQPEAAPAAQPETAPAAQEAPAAAQEAAEAAADAPRIYWTKSGKTYHMCRACTALARSKDVREGSLPDALAAGKKSACNYCAAAKA
jgi:hypothetical protein